MKKIILFFILILQVFLFSSCNTTDSVNNIQDDDYKISFIDDDGRKINLKQPCEKIISLYSAHTENIFSLGAGDKIIGGHTTCIYPPEAAFLPMYDYNGDPEKIIAAAPDLVLIRPFISRKVPQYIETIEKHGITVVSLYPESFDKFEDYINKLALLTGTEENAKYKINEFYSNIQNIRDITKDIEEKKKVFFESTENEIRTVTDDSMPAYAIETAGGINIAKGSKPITKGSTISSFGIEKVIENAQNIDVYVSQRGSMNSGGNLISINERPGYDTVKAIKENKVFLINEKIISSPTFRFYKGIKEMARFMYPEIIDSIDGYKNDKMATKQDLADIIVKYMHTPIYLPSSSKYYQTKQKGHTYGMFKDVKCTDEYFDAIETSVHSGYINWNREVDGEYFYPNENITRYDLAQTIFIVGNFKNKSSNTTINDIDSCKNPKIVQILVDNNVFDLKNGFFKPNDNVTCQEIIDVLFNVEKLTK